MSKHPMRTITMDALEWQVLCDMLEDYAQHPESNYFTNDAIYKMADNIFREASL